MDLRVPAARRCRRRRTAPPYHDRVARTGRRTLAVVTPVGCEAHPTPGPAVVTGCTGRDPLHLRTAGELQGAARGEVDDRKAAALRVDLGRDATPVPWLLADAAADLMAGDGMPRLRRCANHGMCVLLFLDTSRSHTRRWCSMELCGNRSKVAAHSARARQRPRSAGSAVERP